MAVQAAALYAATGVPDSAHIAPSRDPVTVLDAVSASNRFEIGSYKQGSGGDGNIFFSPLSLHLAFSALSERAGGETAAQTRRSHAH